MEEKLLSPAIVVINYNRPESTKLILRSIESATYLRSDIPLVISIDSSDRSDEIEEIANSFQWNHGEKIILRRKERLGLKKHILECGSLSDKYGAVIMLEDDLYVSKNFYEYASKTLTNYDNSPNIAGVSLYCHAWNGYGHCFFTPKKSEFDTYFGQFSITWGQCWTKKQFNGFKKWLEENEEFVDDELLPIDVRDWGAKSWGRLFFRYIVKNDLYYVIPYNSFLTNFSNAGEHNDGISSSHQVVLESYASNKSYNFPSFDDGIVYDSFFDRVLKDTDIVNNIPGNLICVDLNNCKRVALNKKYLLTDVKYKNLKEVNSYGLYLRPVEQNACEDIKGKEIFLYELPGTSKFVLNRKKMSKYRLFYELYGFRFNVLIKSGMQQFSDKVKTRLKRIFK